MPIDPPGDYLMLRVLAITVFLISQFAHGQTYGERLLDLQDQIDDMKFRRRVEADNAEYDRQIEEIRRLREKNQTSQFYDSPCMAFWDGSKFVWNASLVSVNQPIDQIVAISTAGSPIHLYFSASMLATDVSKKTVGELIRKNEKQIRAICPKLPKLN